LQPGQAVYSRKDGAGSFLVGLDNGAPFVEVGGQRKGGGPALPPNSWHHLAVVADAGKMTLFIDGAPAGSLSAALPGLKGDAVLGGDGTATGGFTGEIDEIDISRVARPAAFLKLAALTQPGNPPSKLLAFGPDEQAANWMSGTAGILLRSLTPDGWAVIVILILMSIGSWIIMISKAGYLTNVGRGNALFLKEWRRVASDLTVLDGGAGEMQPLGKDIGEKGQKAIRVAPIYHIYHIGAEEIGQHLTAGPRGDGKYLSVRAIQAIRATLDGSVIREQQALNAQMVLLTICISGGPFLGLLGTVVGVMITFATIAQAGDVNVNSIAPGIAAALVATVAGLVVAIPALFGYNYLLSRVKDATSNMHVFVDEFVTKMANFYGAGE
jgi:biopolymer transport protein ExbB